MMSVGIAWTFPPQPLPPPVRAVLPTRFESLQDLNISLQEILVASWHSSSESDSCILCLVNKQALSKSLQTKHQKDPKRKRMVMSHEFSRLSKKKSSNVLPGVFPKKNHPTTKANHPLKRSPQPVKRVESAHRALRAAPSGPVDSKQRRLSQVAYHVSSRISNVIASMSSYWGNSLVCRFLAACPLHHLSLLPL